MDFHRIVGIISGIVLFISLFPYLASIINRKTVPNIVTWVIWTGLGLVLLSSYHDTGAKETIWFAIMSFTNPLVILLFALKYGEKSWSWSDVWCLIGGIIGIICWKYFGNATAGVISCLVADTAAAYLMIRKVNERPWSESCLGWVMYFASAVLGVIAIREWTWGIAIFPVYMVIMAGFITLPLVRYRLNLKKRASRMKSQFVSFSTLT
jgi:hypothetical protein